MATKKNPYKTLGISPEADEREIRAAYRNLAKKYHPDTGEGSSAERFRAVQEAYDFLIDTERRKECDKMRAGTSRNPVRPVYDTRRSVHLDLRDIMRQRVHSVVETTMDARETFDPWEELIELFFRRF